MRSRDVLALAARGIVGCVLVYAGASKAAAPAEEFAYVIQAYDILPASLSLMLAGLLPWVELLVGWALILGVETRAAAAAAGALFVAFLAALGSVVARALPLPNCGCFGDAAHFTPAQAFGFDVLMAALCREAYRAGPGRWSLDHWVQ